MNNIHKIASKMGKLYLDNNFITKMMLQKDRLTDVRPLLV
jgi:hypothetical protein